MRTTVDIPEGLLRRVKARAAMDGMKMKDLVNEALRKHLGAGGEDEESRRLPPERVDLERIGRFRLPVIRASQPGRVVVTPERLKELELEEDLERHGAIFGH